MQQPVVRYVLIASHYLSGNFLLAQSHNACLVETFVSYHDNKITSKFRLALSGSNLVQLDRSSNISAIYLFKP